MNTEDVISIEEVYLKILKPEDIHDGYIDALNDPVDNKYLDDVKNSLQTYSSVLNFITTNLSSSDSLLFGIWHKKSNNKNIGTIKLRRSSEEVCDIGICLFDKIFWNKKIGTKAIKALSNWALINSLCNKIVAGIYIENKASVKSFINAGYVLFDINSEKYSLNGRVTNVLFFEYTLK